MQYIALGDSISIDEYPRRETGRSGLGAASLFFRDLERRYPGITFVDLTADGATTQDVLNVILSRAKDLRRLTTNDIVTITAGGNDMLMYLRSPHPPARLVEGIIERLERIVDRLRRATILIGTVYDPSDGTNVLYGERLDREAAWLAKVNGAIRRIAATHENVRLIDIHKHFLGHGITAPPHERWYWSELIFEPNARGASEVRRLWLDALP